MKNREKETLSATSVRCRSAVPEVDVAAECGGRDLASRRRERRSSTGGAAGRGETRGPGGRASRRHLVSAIVRAGRERRETYDSQSKLREQRRQFKEVRRRGGPDNEFGGWVPEGGVTPVIADDGDRSVVRENAICARRSVSKGREKKRERRTVRVLLVLDETDHDGFSVVTDTEQVDLTQLDSRESPHRRPQQPSMRLKQEQPQVLPVLLQRTIDEPRLEGRQMQRRRQIRMDGDCCVFRLAELRVSDAELEVDHDGVVEEGVVVELRETAGVERGEERAEREGVEPVEVCDEGGKERERLRRIEEKAVGGGG
jgi:hypothetical protein